MSVINENNEIPIMNKIRHKYDKLPSEDISFDYTNELFNKTISPFMLSNPKIKMFTETLSKMMSVMIDSTMGIRNFFYYTHDKYYNKNGK